MIIANLAFLVLLGQAPVPDPAALVRQLGASRYSEREAAAGALERLGREALPALRLAQRWKDPEVRTRAAALVDKIEGALLTQPTLVSLDFEDRPLADVVKSIREQSGIRVTLVPENSPIWANTRINLRESAPLPFWKAVDRLCDAGQLQYNVLAIQSFPNNREPVFPLYAGNARPTGPMTDQGPFRVLVMGLHYQRDVSFQPGVVAPPVIVGGRGIRRGVPPRQVGPQVPGRPSHQVNEQFSMQLQVAAEPRLAVNQNGPLKVIEAVDDLGQSLKTPAGNQVAQRFSGYFGISPGSSIQVQVPLVRPQQPGHTIQRFRAELPLSVSTRKPNPLVITLAGASGKSFQNDEVSLVVQEVKANNPNPNQSSIELTVRMLGNQGATLDLPGANGESPAFVRPELPQQQQLEVLDAQGRVLPWYLSSFDADRGLMRLTTTSPDQALTPTELRFYGLARANTEVVFQFADIPLP